MKRISASKLKRGDKIRVWWAPGYDIVDRIEDYPGDIGEAGAVIIFFNKNRTGMTAFRSDKFFVHS